MVSKPTAATFDAAATLDAVTTLMRFVLETINQEYGAKKKGNGDIPMFNE